MRRQNDYFGDAFGHIHTHTHTQVRLKARKKERKKERKKATARGAAIEKFVYCGARRSSRFYCGAAIEERRNRRESAAIRVLLYGPLNNGEKNV